MTVYILVPDWQERRERIAAQIEGRVVMYRLLDQQRRFSGGDVGYAEQRLARALGDRAEHDRAPQGTAFVSRSSKSPELIWVVAEDGKEVYFGPRAGYVAAAAAPGEQGG